MRYLRQQVLNRRAPSDRRLYVDMTDSVVMNTTNNMLMPVGTTSQRPVSPINGMIRYNTDINTTGGEVEVYQNGTWRSLRYKESQKIIQQQLNPIDGLTYFYGPLNDYYNPINLSSNVPLSGGVAVGEFRGQNILVFVENVFQVYGTNYTISHNPVATVTTTVEAANGSSILTFDSTASIPNGSIASGLNIQSNTTATVINDTQVTLNQPIDGGNIPVGTEITFTAAEGYYLNFTGDLEYIGLVGKPITVLIGFDQ